MQRARERGEVIDLERGRETLADHCETYWRRHVVHLEENTRNAYRSAWVNHLSSRIGSFRLRDITPAVVEQLRADLAADGVGPAVTRKALALLSGMLTAAVRWDRIDRNPVAVVGLPSARRKRHVRPIAPAKVESLRSELLAGDNGPRDAALLGLIAYAGLRPQEARALRWGDLGERTLRIERAASGRRVKSTKNEKLRTVRLLAPLAADLSAWRNEHADAPEDGWVFPTGSGAM